MSDCVICRREAGDDEPGRVLIWQDPLWRLPMSHSGQVAGFAYLEPERHIPYVTDLDGEEACTFGEVWSRVTRVLREESGAELVYITAFGGSVPHLHVHLPPHRSGDVLNDLMLRGEMGIRTLDSGLQSIVSKDFPIAPETDHRAVAQRVRQRLASLY
jgi:diadenosine tetraphosphate (Ap4A) HIT family hydrolase